MPRNGSGTFERTDGTRTGSQVWQDANSSGVDIEPDDHDTHDEDIADEMTNSVAVDGQSTMTGALKMGSQKITGLAAGTAATDAANVSQVQGDASSYATETGIANTYDIGPSPAVTSLATGAVFRWKPGNVNTGASTLNVSTLGDTAIVSTDGAALTGGELPAGRLVVTVYDGTNHVLLGVQNTLTLIDTDAGTTQGPVLNLKRVSASPAAGDDLGAIEWYGLDDGSAEHLYARLLGNVLDETDGTEDGELIFSVSVAGSQSSRMRIRGTDVIVNETQDDALANPAFVIRRNSASPADDDLGGYIAFQMDNSAIADTEMARVQVQATDVTAATEDATLDLQVAEAGTLTTRLRVQGGDPVACVRDAGAPLSVNRTTDDGSLVLLQQGGTTEGSISVAGNLVSYNGFLGSHWSLWADGCDPGKIPRGTLLSAVDEPYERADGSIKPNYVKCRVTAERACRRIYGVFDHFDPEHGVIVNAVGAGLVRVRGPVAGGDLLMASDEPGLACVQDDDVIRAHTVGKATMGHDGTGEGLVPVTLVSG